MLFFTVHHDFQWMFKAYMAYVFCLLYGRHLVQYVFLQNAVASVSVYCKVSHTERCQVLEEVRTLRGVHMIVLQPRLDNDACCRDVGPLDRNAQPRVARTPSPWADEHVVGSRTAIL